MITVISRAGPAITRKSAALGGTDQSPTSGTAGSRSQRFVAEFGLTNKKPACSLLKNPWQIILKKPYPCPKVGQSHQ